MTDKDRKPTVLVIDDEPLMRKHLSALLESQGYTATTAENGVLGLAAARQGGAGLILLDFMMPQMDGMAVLRSLKSDPQTRLIPVIMLTAAADMDTKIRALDAGADDFLAKPVESAELRARMAGLLKLRSYVSELESAEGMLFAVAEIAEARDACTGAHCRRLSVYSEMLGRAFHLPDAELTALRRAGVLHDLGKIAVPDHILLSTRALTPEEWAVMRQHPATGERLLMSLKSFDDVRPLVRHHHEHLDGSGYPDGLRGEAIPLTVRIFQVVDAYDALRMRRPYKEPFSKAEAFRLLADEAGRGKWDARVVEALATLFAGDTALEETYAAR